MEEKQYSREEVIEVINLARLGKLDNEIVDYESIAGLTEICTYGLKIAYTDEEILSKIESRI